MKKLLKPICMTLALASLVTFSACSEQNHSQKQNEDEMQYERPIEEEWRNNQFPLVPHMPHHMPKPPSNGSEAPSVKKVKPHKPLPIRPTPRPVRPNPLEI